MKRKARIQAGIDDRLVAIYARKSRITNKGDSIGVQFKQSADYAVNQLSLPEDYEFIQYEDKGLSGYYSDRPDFQRLLRDVEMGKIKAVACYKLDRISRKTSDLMRLLEYFERHDVTLLVCSNNINTQISTSKIIIQVLAIIAEFERDILTERIQDNLMELAKDGRWLGGKTPTGFSSKRVTTGSGKNKSAISFLVPIEEEKEIVLEIYRTFWETRSLLQTANLISEKYETKHGAKFTTSTIRLILRNPIYCVADEYSYNYFLEHDGNLFGEAHEFDGKHGLSAYNKTDQMKVEDEDSTFFNPKFSQLLTKKPISEWIVSVGRHEGFISSRKWVETQNMLDEIAEKYNRPHRKTNALLSGLMYCPICGKRLRVLPESNRWTNGKPRFKYACPGVRAKECTFKGVEGVTLDEFVIHSLSSLQEEHSDYYRQLLENRVASMIRTDQGEKEYQETKKAIERLNADIAAQVRNLREADDALKRFIQDDIKVLTDDLAKREADLRRIENTQSENHYLIHELNSIKKRLLSFEEFAKDAQPETLFTLVHSIVDRIYITTDGSTQKCQVYIKGCATEDYSDILGAAEYIDGKFLLPVATYMPPMCDLDKYSIINIILAFVISCYMLFGKQRLIKSLKRVAYAIFPEEICITLFTTLKDCNQIFSQYIIGKTLDSTIIGFLCLFCMTVLKLPYALIISLIVGITNMIPYFGPFIGAIPGILILLIISPKSALIFAILILAIQQLDGSVIGPKILGKSTGLQPISIIFAITVGGALAGPLGMFLGVPIVAVLTYLISKLINFLLRKKHIEPDLSNTKEYQSNPIPVDEQFVDEFRDLNLEDDDFPPEN